MNQRRRTPATALASVRLLSGAAATSLVRHWALALFSLAAGFGAWILVQDVENPRAEGVAPETGQPIAVQALNVSDNAIVRETLTVRVRVEARAADLPNLRADDFRATVDLKGAAPGDVLSRAVFVESRRSGVRVLSVQPPSLPITLDPAATRDMPVQARFVGEFPTGYRVKEGSAPNVEPAVVRVRGTAAQVESVQSVDLDINISGAKDETLVVEGELVARSAAGNRVDVTISPGRARVTIRTEQTLSQRTVAIIASVTGSPASGYRVTNIVVDPPSAVVVGPKAVVDGLRALSAERVDVTGARTDITQTKQVDRPPNVTSDRPAVVVRVEVAPIECTAQPGAPCGSATLFVAPLLTGAPVPLAVEGSVSIPVRVSGPIAVLALLKPSDVRAVVSLAGASVGQGTFAVTVTIPLREFASLRVEPVDPVSLRLIPVGVP